MIRTNKGIVFIMVMIGIISTLACGQVAIGIVTPTHEIDESESVNLVLPPDNPPQDKNSQGTASNNQIVDNSYLDKIERYPPSLGSNWLIYSNNKFAFQYPDRWQMNEQPARNENGVGLAKSIHLRNGDYELVIWYKPITDQLASFSKQPVGEEVDMGTSILLGEEVSKKYLYLGGENSTIIYGDRNWLKIGSMAFSITIINNDDSEYLGPAFPQEVVLEIDKMLASMAMAGVDYYPPGPISINDDLNCENITANLDLFTCSIRDSIRSGDLSPLLDSMANPFAFGYWGSEWTSKTPQMAIAEMQNS